MFGVAEVRVLYGCRCGRGAVGVGSGVQAPFSEF